MKRPRFSIRCLRPALAAILLCGALPSPAQDIQASEEVCLACSREAWEGDSAAVNKFIASCGVIDTVGYDTLNAVATGKQVAMQKVSMKLHSGKVLYSDSIYNVADVEPQFPGGMEGMFDYLKKSLRYPAKCRASGVQGTVYVTFIVERDGTVRQARVVRGIGSDCDAEALRVVGAMDNWQPGKKNDKPVRVRMNLPVRFKLG
jgi:TonB family protein